MIPFYMSAVLAFGQQPAEPPQGEPPVSPPAEPTPAEPTPAEPAPVEPAPVEPAPVEPATLLPVEPAPGEPLEPAPDLTLPDPGLPIDVPIEGEDREPRRFGVNIEYGMISNTDPAFDWLSESNAMRSFGLTGSVRLVHNLSVVAGWHQVRQGADIYASFDETDADFQSDQLVFRSSILANEATLGARFDVPVVDVLFPFVSAQGALVTDLIRLDDDLDDRENPTQVKESAVHTGGLFTAGSEVRFPPLSDVQLAFSMEFGYAWLSRASFGDLGEMKPGGFAFRLGTGVRF